MLRGEAETVEKLAAGPMAAAVQEFHDRCAGMDDATYEAHREASGAGRLLDALSRFGALFGCPDLGSRVDTKVDTN